MALIHVQEADHSLDSELADTSGSNGDIYSGDPIVREAAGGGCHLLDPANDSRVDGLVVNLELADNIAQHDEDTTSNNYGEYPFTGDGTVSGDSDRVPFQPISENDVVIPYTIEDDGTNGAPSIQRNDVVGFVDLGDGGGVGLVEEGYTDDASDTYNDGGGAGDFVPIGRAQVNHGETVDDFNTLVEVRVDQSA